MGCLDFFVHKDWNFRKGRSSGVAFLLFFMYYELLDTSFTLVNDCQILFRFVLLPRGRGTKDIAK